MTDQYYSVPENPDYDAEHIRKIQDSDPVKASAIVNPVLERMIANTAAVKKIAESKAAGTPEFEEAETLENIQSGESMPGILGKLKKWYASLHRVAWSGRYGDLENIPSAFTPASHTHDDRYFTETEVTTKLAGKSDTSHTHTAAQVGAAASNHTHDERYFTETEVTTKLNTKATVTNGTFTPTVKGANGGAFNNYAASGSYQRIGNVAVWQFQTKLSKSSVVDNSNLWVNGPFGGYTFGVLYLTASSAPTFRNNWLIGNRNKGSCWVFKHGGEFAYTTDTALLVGDAYTYWGYGVTLIG